MWFRSINKGIDMKDMFKKICETAMASSITVEAVSMMVNG